MKIVCPECKKEFAAAEALSGGWLTPKKVFGCPHCRTFFTTNPFHALVGISSAVILFTNALSQFVQYRAEQDARHLYFALGSLLLAACLTLGYWHRFRKSVKTLERVR